MSYKSVYVCEECKIEEPAIYRAGTDNGPAVPELPQSWWQLGQRDTTILTFCSKKCLVAAAGKQLWGEPIT